MFERASLQKPLEFDSWNAHQFRKGILPFLKYFVTQEPPNPPEASWYYSDGYEKW